MVNARPVAISLMGPTATGKTDLALLLAERLPVDVISVDSALIYRGMNIGTAKPDADFLSRLPHRLIDIRDVGESYSVAEFRRDALEAMAEIVANNRIPLLVGGTMMYFKALIEGLADMPATDSAIRERVTREASELGWPRMHAQLAELDPESAARIHPNHSQRIQRALEVFYSSGKPLSAWQAEQASAELPYQFCQFALLPSDRNQLHQRIEQRFLAMLEAGFVEEVRQLRAKHTLSADMMSMRAVGYRQAWEYLEGLATHEQMMAKGIAVTRQLAKRQLTWLRKWPNLVRCEVEFGQNEPLLAPRDVIFSEIGSLIDEN